MNRGISLGLSLLLLSTVHLPLLAAESNLTNETTNSGAVGQETLKSSDGDQPGPALPPAKDAGPEISDLASPVAPDAGPGAVAIPAAEAGGASPVELNDLAAPLGTQSEPAKTAADKSDAGSSGELGDLVVPVNAQPATSSVTTVQLRKRNEDALLALPYPDHYPYPLVGIQFPVDYTTNFPVDIASFKAFRKHSAALREQLVSEQVVRSTYLACALYKSLQEKLPVNSVILIPTKLQYDSTNHRVVSFPMNKAVPPVVLVDLYADVNMDRVNNPAAHLGQADTFGDRARTMVSMSMPIEGKRQVFGGAPVTSAKTDQVGENIETFYNVHCNGGTMKGAGKIGSLIVSAKPQYVNGTFVALQSDFRYPYKELLGAPCQKQLRYYSNIIIDALNSQSLDSIKNSLLAEYVDDIDVEFAEALTSHSAKPPALFERKLKYFDHFLPAEREQLFAKDSSEVAKIVVSGDLGKQYLSSLKDESDFVRETAASKRRAAFGSVLTLASTAGAVASAFTPVPTSVGAMCTTMAVSAAGMVAVQLKLQKELRTAFTRTNAISRGAQVKCVLMLDNDKIEVDGDTAETFRKSLLQGYQKKFGSTAARSQGVL